MFSLLVRLIPYLYYFIKESHRRDLEEEMPAKKRTKYRTYVAVLVAALILGSIFGYARFRKDAEALGLCLVEVQKVKDSVVGSPADYITRTQYDHDLDELSHKNTELAIYNEMLLEKVREACTKDPDKCGVLTKKLIEKVERLHPPGEPEPTGPGLSEQSSAVVNDEAVVKK